MYTVQYYCPRQGDFWQGQGQFPTFQVAVGMAQVLKPPMGSARVLDGYGQVVYQI